MENEDGYTTGVSVDSTLDDSGFGEMYTTDEDLRVETNVGDPMEMQRTNADVEHVDPIPACDGLPRSDWKDRDVVLVNMHGVEVADAVCCNVDPTDCIDQYQLGSDDIGVVIMSSLNQTEVDETWRFSLRRWPLRQVLYNGVSLYDHDRRYKEIQSELLANLRPRKGSRKYDSIRAPRTTLEAKREKLVKDEHIRQVATKDCCASLCCQMFPRDKIKALREEMWLADFRFRSSKKLEAHRNMHVGPGGRKFITLENIDVCANAWFTIHGVSRSDFYRHGKYALEGRRSRYHGNLGSKKPREATRQAAATLSNIIVPMADAMPHKTRTLPTGEKVVQMVLPTGTKWKDILVDVNDVGVRVGCGQISLSKLSVIKKQQFGEYITKKAGDKFARCSKCIRHKLLRDAHPVGSDPYNAHQQNYMNHVNMQEAHRHDYYKNRALSIARPLEVMTIIHDKMDHAKTACPCYAHKDKAIDGLFRLPVSVTGTFR